jgi:2-methylisocitrate lyase-like PEP mutase family enzyme
VRSGVAALSLEDQEAPKKSSTLAGRRVISQDEHVGKLQAAVAARDDLDPDFVICARCDVLGAEGSNFDEALARCITYVEDGGADFIWLNSVETREQVKRACKEIPAPVLAIWGGKDAPPTEAEYEKLGLRIILYPVFCATAGLQAAWELLNEVRADGGAALHAWHGRANTSKWGRAQQTKLVDAARIRQIEDNYLPKEAQRDYASTWGHRIDFSETAKTPAKSKARSR